MWPKAIGWPAAQDGGVHDQMTGLMSAGCVFSEKETLLFHILLNKLHVHVHVDAGNIYSTSSALDQKTEHFDVCYRQALNMSIRESTVVSILIIILLYTGGNLANKKKNEEIQKKCDACRELVKSFKEGMERTARYNFAGGDTDWEEKKLGKYSTSETRLIEIVEKLCSKDNHECNAMLEQNEETLESWWNEQQSEHPDLLVWFCIDTLTICCPDNTYGPECQECPGGLERPCKDNGKCSGGGTRAGTGKCKCNGGYKGELCDICKNGFYTEMSNETHTVCTACDESCAATCTKGGPTGCKKCKGGYTMDEEHGCLDIDECNQQEPPCQKTEFCENSPGSYKCATCHMACEQCIGEGPESCVKCKTGFQMEETTCKDIDECVVDEPCNKEHMTCKNVPGSFLCECDEDFLQTGDGCVPKTILEGKDGLKEPELSLKDGDAPPTENTVQEADETITNGGESINPDDILLDENSESKTEDLNSDSVEETNDEHSTREAVVAENHREEL